VVGLAFFILALLMPLEIHWAPLEFGIVWCASLVGISLHLRQLHHDAPPESRPPPRPLPQPGDRSHIIGGEL
jgi:hypothetical protein